MSKVCGVWTAGDFNAKDCIGYNFGEGIKKQGYTIEQHYPALLQPMNPPFCHLAVSNGLRAAPARTAQFLKEKADVSTIVYDLGYIDRSDCNSRNGYYQMGLNRLGWLPDFECPSDRFNNLGVSIPRVVDNHKDTVLVCAQKFNDPQHGMGAQEMHKVMKGACDYYKDLGFKVLFRPHPKSKFGIEGYESPKETLQESLGKCRLMVTYNSTAGVDALLQGVPVVAIAEEVHYKSVTAKLSQETLSLPTNSQLESYFYKLAYAQWKLEEVKAGYPFKFLLAVINGENPFSFKEDYTFEQPKPEVKLDITGMSWNEARKHVKAITGRMPSSKANMEEIVEKYNV